MADIIGKIEKNYAVLDLEWISNHTSGYTTCSASLHTNTGAVLNGTIGIGVGDSELNFLSNSHLSQNKLE